MKCFISFVVVLGCIQAAAVADGCPPVVIADVQASSSAVAFATTVQAVGCPSVVLAPAPLAYGCAAHVVAVEPAVAVLARPGIVDRIVVRQAARRLRLRRARAH